MSRAECSQQKKCRAPAHHIMFQLPCNFYFFIFWRYLGVPGFIRIFKTISRNIWVVRRDKKCVLRCVAKLLLCCLCFALCSARLFLVPIFAPSLSLSEGIRQQPCDTSQKRHEKNQVKHILHLLPCLGARQPSFESQWKSHVGGNPEIWVYY